MDAAILKNLANWMMLEKCHEINLNPSSSYVKRPQNQKQGERTYTLVKRDTNRPFMQVTFTKSNAPRFIY